MSIEEKSKAAAASGSKNSHPATAVHFAGDGAGRGQDSEMLSLAPEGVLEGEVVDQRVWGAIAALRERGIAKKAVARDLRLQALLADAAVLGHPFVIGEVALGHLRHPAIIVALLKNLPQAGPATHEEVLYFVTENRLPGTGGGWVDVHLLCSAALARSRLWTLDRRLAAQASRLGLGE